MAVEHSANKTPLLRPITISCMDGRCPLGYQKYAEHQQPQDKAALA
jgi:hypothetical protein